MEAPISYWVFICTYLQQASLLTFGLEPSLGLPWNGFSQLPACPPLVGRHKTKYV